MAKRKSRTDGNSNGGNATDTGLPVADVRHPAAKRRNIPPAKIAAEGTVPVVPKIEYAYNPHLPPVLRFDQHGTPDALPELLTKARRGPLSDDDVKLLASALRKTEPWLEWTGKREKPGFAVDPVALHIHERISAQAILNVAARQDVNKSLFADPQQEYHEAVQFYRHDVDWSNRLILGDSLQVMSSLARREDLAGKVQMIYMDPPYGIKFASNFQPEVGKRDVKDKQEDLTREPEMVRAYRDTWHLGIHSYLSYLRDRLIAARELLSDTGSIFVQISDENLHRVRNLLDEVFGSSNFVSQIEFRTTAARGAALIDQVSDKLLWFAKEKSKAKYRQLLSSRSDATIANYDWTLLIDGSCVDDSVAKGDRFVLDNLTSQGETESGRFVFDSFGAEAIPGSGRHWATTEKGLERLLSAERIQRKNAHRFYRRMLQDYEVRRLNNSWDDTAAGGFLRGSSKLYVVQTNTLVVQRCILMTTDSGDLVFDPTCGSGTTAYVAEQWGRRWVTTDTSRVAVAIARQRLLTAKFDAYKTKATRLDSRGNAIPDPASGFHYKTVPHVTLKSIAQNVALDPIFAKHEPILDAALKRANDELVKALNANPELRGTLSNKLVLKQKQEGKRAITDADRRRWLLPPDNRDKGVKYTVDASFAGWYAWEMPFDADPDYPKPLAEAVTAYRAAWRAKMDEVNACIKASAEQEELVDQPEPVRGVTRVSGPFTVEAVQPPEMTLGEPMEVGGFAGAPAALDGAFVVRPVEPRNELEVANVGAYLDQMYRFLKADGVRFLSNKQMRWTRLDPLFESGKATAFHAEGRWTPLGEEDPDPTGPATVAVIFGPQYGPVTALVVVEAMRQAHRRGYDHVVLAGFNFDGPAQAEVDNQGNPRVKIHLAHIRPDINPGMDGLLKESPKPGSGQLFTVFGQPRITVRDSKAEPGMLEVEMEGVDIYNPATDEVMSTGAGKVAAWFLDGDYDGRTFCVTQAFFPDRGAWEKLQKALNGKDGPIDAERFEAFAGTVSLPFPKGKHGVVAVKVIDPRGNEVMAVEKVSA